MTRTLRTIEDLLEETYGAGIFGKRVAKDAAVTTSTTGVFNAIYGAQAFAQVAYSQSAFGMLPKKPWKKSGYRAISAASSTSGGGLSEGGAIPGTEQATFAEVKILPKEHVNSFDMTTKQLALEGKDDILPWEEHRANLEETHINLINRALCKDNDTLAGDNIESLDRIIGSYSEIDGVGQNAGDLDPWTETVSGINRDASASAYDSYVSHNSGTDRYLATSHIDSLITNCAPYWKGGTENKGFLTGYDTLMRWSQLMQPLQRLDVVRANLGLNGVQTLGNTDSGLIVNAYNGIPIIASDNVEQDTISRIYLLDLDNISFETLSPTKYMQSEDYQAIDKFVREAVYYTAGELWCRKFKAQGKVRDLK